MDLKVRVEEKKKGFVLIDLAGDMDAFTSKEFKNVVADVVKRRRYRLLVDLERVTCIDSAGTGELLDGLKKSRQKKGDLWLIYDKSPVRKFLGVTGLDERFTVFKTRRQAFKELGIS